MQARALHLRHPSCSYVWPRESARRRHSCCLAITQRLMYLRWFRNNEKRESSEEARRMSWVPVKRNQTSIKPRKTEQIGRSGNQSRCFRHKSNHKQSPGQQDFNREILNISQNNYRTQRCTMGSLQIAAIKVYGKAQKKLRKQRDRASLWWRYSQGRVELQRKRNQKDVFLAVFSTGVLRARWALPQTMLFDLFQCSL